RAGCLQDSRPCSLLPWYYANPIATRHLSPRIFLPALWIGGDATVTLGSSVTSMSKVSVRRDPPNARRHGPPGRVRFPTRDETACHCPAQGSNAKPPGQTGAARRGNRIAFRQWLGADNPGQCSSQVFLTAGFRSDAAATPTRVRPYRQADRRAPA